MSRNRLTLFFFFGFLAVLFGIVWYFDLMLFLSLAHFQTHAQFLSQWTANHFFLSLLLYLICFAAIIAASIPATGPLTLLGGFLFGTARGSILATIGATIGAAISFLILRRGIREGVKDKYGKHLQNFEKNMEAYGPFYLLILHFSTVVPYGFINLLAALAGISLRTIVWTTAIGFIPLATVYAFAGSRLTEITSVQDLFSPQVVIAFVLLILMMFIPILIKNLQKRGRS